MGKKPDAFQRTPEVPNFDEEAKEALKYEGLPPLTPKNASAGVVLFTNVKSVFTRSSAGISQTLVQQGESTPGVVVVINGKVVCTGLTGLCVTKQVMGNTKPTVVDLEGGSISPGLVSYGAPLGLQHIQQEPSTADGRAPDPLLKPVPKILGGDTAIIRAVDGLQYSSRDAL